MQELTIKYNRHKNPKVFNLVLPGTWNELSESNILYIGNLWQAWQMMIKDNLSLKKARGLLLLELTGFKGKKLVDLCEAFSNLDEEIDFDVLSLTDFIFNDFKLNRNLVPVIRLNQFDKYHGPADKLSDISIDEFSFAFSCYTQFHKTNEEHYLDKLAAVLYRPYNPHYEKTGDKKVPFNNKLVDKYEVVFSRLPDGYKNAIYLFFKGCLDFIAKKFPEVFNSENKGKSGGSFNKTIIAMSGDKFGSYDQTKVQNLYIVLETLQDLIIQNQKDTAK